MALSTEFTRRFGVRHPIALAAMGGSAGGALAGEAVDLITDVASAVDLVATLAVQAEQALANAGRC
jgi:hypothetical protein